jgi:hypothetical protein
MTGYVDYFTLFKNLMHCTDLPLEGERHRKHLRQERFIVLLNVHGFFNYYNAYCCIWM